MKQIITQKKLKKNFTIRRPHLSIGGVSAGLVKDHTFTFCFGDPSLSLTQIQTETEAKTETVIKTKTSYRSYVLFSWISGSDPCNVRGALTGRWFPTEIFVMIVMNFSWWW